MSDRLDLYSLLTYSNYPSAKVKEAFIRYLFNSPGTEGWSRSIRKTDEILELEQLDNDTLRAMLVDGDVLSSLSPDIPRALSIICLLVFKNNSTQAQSWLVDQLREFSKDQLFWVVNSINPLWPTLGVTTIPAVERIISRIEEFNYQEIYDQLLTAVPEMPTLQVVQKPRVEETTRDDIYLYNGAYVYTQQMHLPTESIDDNGEEITDGNPELFDLEASLDFFLHDIKDLVQIAAILLKDPLDEHYSRYLFLFQGLYKHENRLTLLVNQKYRHDYVDFGNLTYDISDYDQIFKTVSKIAKHFQNYGITIERFNVYSVNPLNMKIFLKPIQEELDENSEPVGNWALESFANLVILDMNGENDDVTGSAKEFAKGNWDYFLEQ